MPRGWNLNPRLEHNRLAVRQPNTGPPRPTMHCFCNTKREFMHILSMTELTEQLIMSHMVEHSPESNLCIFQ